MTAPFYIINAAVELMYDRPIKAIQAIRAELKYGLLDSKRIIDSAKAHRQGDTIGDYEVALTEAIQQFDDGVLLPAAHAARPGDLMPPSSNMAVVEQLLHKILQQMKENNELIRDWIETQS